jgi:hypothetical protein
LTEHERIEFEEFFEEIGCGGVQPAVLAVVEKGSLTAILASDPHSGVRQR